MSKAKFSCELLTNALDTVISTVSSSSNMEILKGIRFHIDKNKCILESTNLTASTVVTLDCKSDDTFEFVTEGIIIQRLMKNLNIDELTLEYKESKINIKGKGIATSLVVLPSSDFPKLEDSKATGVKVKVNAAELVSAVNVVSLASIDSPTMPILKCIHFNIGKDKATLVALDGTKLCYHEVPIESDIEKDVEINVPAKELQNIIKSIDVADNKIEIEVLQEQNKLMINVNNKKFVINCMEGKFVDYMSMLSALNMESNIIASIDELRAAINLVSVIKNSKNNVVTFLIKDDNKVTIKSKNERGNIEKIITSANQGDKLNVSFNSNKFDIINAMNKYYDFDKIIIQLGKKKMHGMVLRPVDDIKLLVLILGIKTE